MKPLALTAAVLATLIAIASAGPHIGFPATVFAQSSSSTLSALTVSPKDIIGFRSGRESYQVGVASTVTVATIAATATDSDASVAITPSDADTNTDGHQVNLEAGRNKVTIAVTSRQLITTEYTVYVNRGVTAERGHKASADLDGMIASGNTSVRGMWSNETTMWVANNNPDKLYAYRLSDLSDGTRDADKEFDLHDDNGLPAGMWSDGTTMWVGDFTDRKVYAYRLSDGTRDATLEFDYHDDNDTPSGIWSNGTTMWVINAGRDDKLYAYRLSDGTRDADKEFDLALSNEGPVDIWSDESTMWVVDGHDCKLYAYRLSDGTRDATLEFDCVSGNRYARALWSDGTTMWVSDHIDQKVYAYNPPSLKGDATLSALRVSPRDITRFISGRESYEVAVASDVTRATVTATANDSAATVAYGGADADTGTDGHQVDLDAGRNEVTVTVTAKDSITTKVYTVSVNRGVVADYGWKATDDLDGLISVGNELPEGIWSDGTTLWVADWRDDKLYAYDLSDGTRDATKEFDLDERNTSFQSMWSDGTTMWVADISDPKLYAYDLSDGTRDATKEFDLHADNRNPKGIWSDRTTMWVADNSEDKLYAYDLSDGTRDATKEFDLPLENTVPEGIWSDGTTMWVVDRRFDPGPSDKIYAYRMSDKTRDADKDFDTLYAAGNNHPEGIWSDGTTMWVTDLTDGKLYSYNMAASDDTTLSALTVSPKDIIGFTAERASYEVGVASTVTQATIAATATDSGATVAIAPADADTNTDGYQVDLQAGRNKVTITVTAEDGSTTEYAVSVNRGVTADYGWKASADLDGLIASGNTGPYGLWSNGTTMWVADNSDDKLYAYGLSDGTRDADKEFVLHDDNSFPQGHWSNGTTLWVVDRADDKLYAYSLSDGTRDVDKEFDLYSLNDDPQGIWSDGTTMWVVDWLRDKLYAYRMSDKTLDRDREFSLASDNGSPQGIWSDGTTMWVADSDDDKLYAYGLSDGTRDAGKDFDTLTASGNGSPQGIWSDGNTMWVADWADDKLYSYNMPPSGDTTLSALTVSPKNIIGFTAGRASYEVGVASTVVQATITATANYSEATVAYSGADADDITDGHQVDLDAGRNEVTVTVTAEDGSTRGYTVSVNRGVTDEYGWKASDDLDGVIAAGNEDPSGIWSNGTTMWVADRLDGKIYAYNADGTRDSAKDFDTLDAAAGNNNPYGIWSDDTTMWVADSSDDTLYAYNLSTRARDSGKDFETLDADGNDEPLGIWSDEKTMWVTDWDDDKIYAYNLNTRARDGGKDFDTLAAAGNNAPSGIWSDGKTMWVVDREDDKLYAYNLNTKAWDSGKDFDTLSAAGNSDPRGIWSDGTTMWVADNVDGKVYSYNMPQSDDPVLVSFGSATYTVAEGGSATVTVTLSDDPERTVVVPVTKTNLGGAASTDYSGVPASLTFNSGQTSRSFTLSATQDDDDDDGESVRLSFGTLPDGVSAGTPATTTVSITDDDDPTVSVSFGSATYTAAEGGSATVTVTLSEDPERTVVIPVAKTNLGGAASSDYSGVPDSLTFNSGQTSRSFTLSATQDDDDDDGESVRLSFGTLPDGVSAGTPATTTVSITDDDDPTVSVSFGSATYTAAEGGSATVTVTLSEDPERTVVVPVTKTNQGGATSSDYSGVPASLTFNSGQTSRSFTLSATQDDEDDDGESVGLSFGTLPDGVSAGTPATTTVSITEPSEDATLSALTVSPRDIIGFAADRTSYEVGVASTVTQATIAATANHADATVAYSGTDADVNTDGHQVDLVAARNKVTITVTAEDGTTQDYTVSVNQGVTAAYGWKASDDLDGLLASDNGSPYGIWSDETTMWVADDDDDKLYAYGLSDGARDTGKEFDLHADNDSPTGIWSDETTMWVADEGDDKIYAYRLSDGTTDTGKEFDLHADNDSPTGIWSDETTMWVADNTDDKLYAYGLSDGTRDEDKEFDLHADNDSLTGIWSDGTTMWVADDDDKLYAYSLSDGTRDEDKDFDTLSASGNADPRGIWSDETTMWVADNTDDKVYSYNMPAPPSDDATLSALTVSPRDIIGFAADRASYEVGVASTVAQATIVATANDTEATLAYSGTDADDNIDGHQVDLVAGRNEVTVTVTAEDGTTQDYTVSVNQGVTTDFGWKASDDLDGPTVAENDTPYGLWSDSTTMWVSDTTADRLYAYRMSDKARDSGKDFNTLTAASNNNPTGMWSDGTTMWVSDISDDKIYAYRMSDKARDSGKDFNTLSTAGNTSPTGLWSDRTTMWVADWTDGKIYAYRMSDKTRDSGKDFNTLISRNNNPAGLWSDGATMWVSDAISDRLYAYRMSSKARDSGKEFNTLSAAGNDDVRGIWSDSATMWVVDATDDKVYSYNMPPPPSDDATLSGLTVSPRDIIGFDADRNSYQVGVAATVTQATITATANHAGAAVTYHKADADDIADGFQMDLSAGTNQIVIFVTAEDGIELEEYDVSVNRGVTDDYGWKAVDDLDGLKAAGVLDPTGIWGNGTTFWVADSDEDKIYAFNADGTRDTTKDFDTLIAAGNTIPNGIWSDGTTMWVADDGDDMIYAYRMSNKSRDSAKDFDTLIAAGNEDPAGIWSDGTTMWVADSIDTKLYAYRMSNKERVSGNDFDTLDAENALPYGMWSDISTMWVADAFEGKIYAYKLDGTRDEDKDFGTLGTAAGNYAARGIWSDGITMWVADDTDRKVYSYNMPPSNDATLSDLTISPKNIIGFDADRTSYEVGVTSSVTQATIAATANHLRATVAITPADGDTNTDGHQVNLSSSGRNAVMITVTAADGTTMETYTVNVNRGVTDTFGWKASDDLDGLLASDNESPYGVWANDTTMWVADYDDDKLYAYRLPDGARDTNKDIDLHDENAYPLGIWSDGTTMWVADLSDATLYAYRLSNGTRDATKEFDLHADNAVPRGIWSDETTMWVADWTEEKLYAYGLSDGTRDEDKEFDLHDDNREPSGIWSDGNTMWVVDWQDDKLYAYSLSDGTRDEDKEFDTLSASGNTGPAGIWSDGTTMWVTDDTDNKVYSYNMPSNDATLSSLTVSPKNIIGFDSGRTSYEVGMASTVTQATIAATTTESGATVAIAPADADTNTDGHQVDLSAGQNAVTITVTAEDGITTQTYTVNVNQGVTTDYGWKAVDDLDGLIPAENTSPFGIWANDTTMWVADFSENKIYAYRLSDGTRDTEKEFDLASGNFNVRGIWSDGTTMWVVDNGSNDKLYAYGLSDGARDTTKEFDLASDNGNPFGIWSDETTIWVADGFDEKLYAYRLSNGARDEDKEFDLASDNRDARGIWSDGTTMWVADTVDDKLYAYGLSDGARDEDKEFDLHDDNANARGIWSDETTMWVADDTDNKVYSYNMPRSEDATLSALTVSPRDIIGFAADRTSYEVGVASTVTQATIAATANHADATVAYSGTDADVNTDGHQVDLVAARNKVTITVTAEDGTTQDYTVSVNQGVTAAYGWKASDDLDGLLASDNGSPYGIWSDETTMWVADDDDDKLYAYGLSDGARDTGKEFDLHADNDSPTGIWSDETTMWVADEGDDKIYAYRLSDGTTDTGKEFDLHADNDSPTGIWSDETTMWVADNTDDKLYAYGLSDGTRDEDKEFDLHADNDSPTGIWSDGTTMWVADDDDKLYAYSLSDGTRDEDKDFDTLSAAGNSDPRGIWSDGTTMWVADNVDGKVYSYNMPQSDDPVLVSFGSATYTVAEGGSATVTVTLSDDPERTVVVPVTKTNLGGAASTDYSGVPASLTFNSGQTSRSFTLSATQDDDDDDGESVRLSFGTLPDGVSSRTPATTTVSITDDDDPTVSVSFGSATYTVAEGASATVTVTLSEDPERTVVVPVTKTNQGGAASTDYSGVPASLTFNSGQTSRSFTFSATPDDDDDDGESVRLGFGTLPDGVSAGTPATTTVSITEPSDDATLSTLTVSPKNIIGFTADRASYEVGVASTVAQATIAATANHADATVVYSGTDADDNIDGHQVDLSAGRNSVTVTVTAQDGNTTETYTVNVNQGVTDSLGWKAESDIDSLKHHEANRPRGVWADSDNVWVLDSQDEKIYGFNRTTQVLARTIDLDTSLTNYYAIWSDGTHIWASHFTSTTASLIAYKLSDGTRAANKDFTTLNDAGNTRPFGIWSDTTTMWIADRGDGKAYAYHLTDNPDTTENEFATHDGAKDINLTGLWVDTDLDPVGAWSDGTTVWLSAAPPSEPTTLHVMAYRVSDRTHEPSLDFDIVSSGNTNPGGIFFDGTTFFISDSIDDKVYAYNMPPLGTDATLSALTVSPKNIIGFTADRTSYEVGMASDVTQATIVATANDTEATLAYSGTDADVNIDGHQVDLVAARNEVTVTVTAEDSSTQDYTVSVNRGVTDTFGWKASDDLDGLRASDNVDPIGIWSDETTMWVADADDDKLYAYGLSDGARDTGKEFDLHADNDSPTGIWSDETTMWVADDDDDKLYAYRLSGGTRDTGKEFDLHADNDSPTGIWSDETTMWVADNTDDKLYAYGLSDGTRDTGKEFDLHADNDSPTGIWSDETTMWVADDDDKLYAYSLSDGTRDEDKDFDTLSASGNADPRGIWSDETTMWVADNTDDKVYSYNMPQSDDPVQVSFGSATYTAAEGASATVTVALSEDPERTVVVPVTKTNLGGATSSDYSGVPNSLTFNSGQTSRSFTFSATPDDEDDDGESVRLGFGALPDGVSLRTPATTTVSITDDDAPTVSVSFGSATYTAAEGGSATVTVALSEDPERTVVVPVTKTNQGGATSSDYSGVPNSVTFDIGETSKSFTFSATPDDDDDDGESVRLGFGTLPDGVSLRTPATTTVSITDDDAPTVSVSFGSATYTAAEGDSATVTVTLSEDPERTVVVPVTKTNQGGATSSDYSGVPNSVTFDIGETSKSFTFSATPDDEDDDGESVRLGFGALPDGVSLRTPATTTVSITDDDAPTVSVSFGSATYTAAEGGSATVTVALSEDPERTVVVPVTKTNQGGATSSDYSGVPNSVTFDIGETSKSFTFSATPDDDDDDGESVRLGFGTLPDGVSLRTPATTTVSITDDDAPTVSVSFGSATYTAAEGGSATVTVTLSEDPERTVVVPVTKTNQGGATSSDYSGVPETLTFNSGETSKSFTFSATQDSDNDDNESVRLSFGTLPDGVSAGTPATTTVNIADDDLGTDPSLDLGGILIYWTAGFRSRSPHPEVTESSSGNSLEMDDCAGAHSFRAFWYGPEPKGTHHATEWEADIRNAGASVKSVRVEFRERSDSPGFWELFGTANLDEGSSAFSVWVRGLFGGSKGAWSPYAGAGLYCKER